MCNVCEDQSSLTLSTSEQHQHQVTLYVQCVPRGYIISWEQSKVGVWSCLPCAQAHQLQRGPGSPGRAGGAPQVFFHLQGAEKSPGQGLRQPETAAERRLMEQLKRGAPPLRTGSKIAPPAQKPHGEIARLDRTIGR